LIFIIRTVDYNNYVLLTVPWAGHRIDDGLDSLVLLSRYIRVSDYAINLHVGLWCNSNSTKR